MKKGPSENPKKQKKKSLKCYQKKSRLNVRMFLDMKQIGSWKINKNGGVYSNGKALNLEIRQEIVRRWINGQNVTSIARDLKVTHGVVSKITRQFKETNSILPKIKKRKNKSKFSIDSILEPSKMASLSTRPVFSSAQTAILTESFFQNEYPSETEKQNLIQKTGLNMDQITTWFNNKRSRIRKSAANCPSTSTTSSAISTRETPPVLPSPSTSTISTSDSSNVIQDSISYPILSSVLNQTNPSTMFLSLMAQQLFFTNNFKPNFSQFSIFPNDFNNLTNIFKNSNIKAVL